MKCHRESSREHSRANIAKCCQQLATVMQKAAAMLEQEVKKDAPKKEEIIRLASLRPNYVTDICNHYEPWRMLCRRGVFYQIMISIPFYLESYLLSSGVWQFWHPTA